MIGFRTSGRSLHIATMISNSEICYVRIVGSGFDYSFCVGDRPAAEKVIEDIRIRRTVRDDCPLCLDHPGIGTLGFIVPSKVEAVFILTYPSGPNSQQRIEQNTLELQELQKELLRSQIKTFRDGDDWKNGGPEPNFSHS